MRIEHEVIADDSGWTFKMPRLTHDMIDKLMLGTWDLADWTFGTCHGIILFYRPVEDMSWFERLVWRVENWFRRKFWEAYIMIEYYGRRSWWLRAKRRIYRKLRHAVFMLAWRLSCG